MERFLDTQRNVINESILATLPATDLPAIVQPLSEEQLPPFLTWENDWSQLGAVTQIGCSSKRYEIYQKVNRTAGAGITG